MNTGKVNGLLIFAALFPWACIATAALMTPRLTRPDIFFSVTVDPSFRASREGGQIIRQYYCFVLAAAALGLMPIGFVFAPHLRSGGLLATIAIELGGCFGAFLVARHRTMPYHVQPTTEREADLTLRQASLPGGWLAQMGPFLILAATCAWLTLNWTRIPSAIPIHWGIGGLPDGWAAKSAISVFGLPLIGAMVCLLLTGISVAVVGVRRINSSGDAGAREARFVRVLSFFLLGMGYWIALLMGLFSLTPLRPNPRAPLGIFWLIPAGEAIIVGIIFVIAYRMGQGGWRPGLPAKAVPVGDRTPDECWKLGVFYVNQSDPALFVEKRFGVGWTLNFANSKAWIFLGAILLFALATVAVSVAISHSNVTAR